MTTTTVSWTENQTLKSAATIAAASSSTNDLDIATAGYDLVVLQFNIAHSSSTGVTVEIFGSVDSGTTDSNETLPGGFSTTGTDVIKTVTVAGQAYIAVKITNDDGSNATGNISVLYAGRKWSTA